MKFGSLHKQFLSSHHCKHNNNNKNTSYITIMIERAVRSNTHISDNLDAETMAHFLEIDKQIASMWNLPSRKTKHHIQCYKVYCILVTKIGFITSYRSFKISRAYCEIKISIYQYITNWKMSTYKFHSWICSILPFLVLHGQVALLLSSLYRGYSIAD